MRQRIAVSVPSDIHAILKNEIKFSNISLQNRFSQILKDLIAVAKEKPLTVLINLVLNNKVKTTTIIADLNEGEYKWLLNKKKELDVTWAVLVAAILRLHFPLPEAKEEATNKKDSLIKLPVIPEASLVMDHIKTVIMPGNIDVLNCIADALKNHNYQINADLSLVIKIDCKVTANIRWIRDQLSNKGWLLKSIKDDAICIASAR